VEETTSKLASRIQREVGKKKNEIAKSLPSRPSAVANHVAGEIADIGIGSVAVELAAPFQKGGVALDVSAEQRAYSEALSAAIAERTANLLETELTPVQRLNPERVKKVIGKAASESVDSIKANLKGETRRELEKAEANLVAAVGAEVEKLGQKDFSTSRDWVDPFVGLRLTSRLSERTFAILYGDIGGFGVGSEQTWQAFAGVGWQWTDQVTVEAGYRYLAIDYEEGELNMDIDLKGFALGLGYAF
jgi:hypothetical protein